MTGVMHRTLLALVAGLLVLACSETAAEPDRSEMLAEDLAQIHAALESYAADHGGALPESLDVLVRPDEEGRHYLPSGTPAIHDPWGRKYVFEPDVDGTYELRRGEAP